MAEFELSSRVEPNETIDIQRAFFPEGHRGVLDLKRQLVVGNRGMGKSFWTHALTNRTLRDRLSESYRLPALAKTSVAVGFNGSEKLAPIAPTTDEIAGAYASGRDPDLIWRAVLLRAALPYTNHAPLPTFDAAVGSLARYPQLYAEVLTAADEALAAQNAYQLVVFDALDRLAQDWKTIQQMTKALLVRAVALQAFRAIRVKIFMRVDQFADEDLFRFPDSSKIKNDQVDLVWRAYELYGLLTFEALRDQEASVQLRALADQVDARLALPTEGRLNTGALREQQDLVTAMAGEFMGTHKKRGRVYTWVPLHLSDAANTCSPRTFLTAWRTAAAYVPPPAEGRVVDHLGLIEGVRKASTNRLGELQEDYPWISPALKALRRQFVPIQREDLFTLWRSAGVLRTILADAKAKPINAPVGVGSSSDFVTLLDVLKSIGVMEERANGKINVPDIFRVEAEILRKGGVAVPRRH